jgi:hypothetical protein
MKPRETAPGFKKKPRIIEESIKPSDTARPARHGRNHAVVYEGFRGDGNIPAGGPLNKQHIATWLRPQKVAMEMPIEFEN